MRHLVLAAFMLVAAVGITLGTATALEGWATARTVTYVEPTTNGVAKQDFRLGDTVNGRLVRPGRERSLAGI